MISIKIIVTDLVSGKKHLLHVDNLDTFDRLAGTLYNISKSVLRMNNHNYRHDINVRYKLIVSEFNSLLKGVTFK